MGKAKLADTPFDAPKPDEFEPAPAASVPDEPKERRPRKVKNSELQAMAALLEMDPNERARVLAWASAKFS